MLAPDRLLHRLPGNTRAIVLTLACALPAALVAVAFLRATAAAHDLGLRRLADLDPTIFLAGSWALMTVAMLAVGLLTHFGGPDTRGSGVPQLKAAYWKDLGTVPARPVWTRFLAGVLTIGGGGSLGREGPTIYMAGGVASLIGRAIGLPRQRLRQATAIGASAGLAAAFNTPLAAIAFVLEELIGDMNSRFIGTVGLAAVVGALVVHALIGPQPAFHLPAIDEPGLVAFAMLPLIAIAATLAGMLFQRATLRWRARAGRSRVPASLRPLLGGWVAWLFAASVFLASGHLGVFGLGYDDLSAALRAEMPWRLATLLLLGKLVATVACYAGGGSGGIFAPTLFLGGLTAAALSGLAGHWIPLTPNDHIMLAAVGMSACFGAVARAPVAASLMVFEMTHQFALIPALMLTAIISQVVGRALARTNFYDALLEQDGADLHRLKPPRDLKDWQDQPVRRLANARPIACTDLAPGAVRALLERHPYACFPLLLPGEPPALVRRDDLQRTAAGGAPPPRRIAATCPADESVRTAEQAFLRSSEALLLVVEDDGRLAGVLTLHDLLRAQVASLE